MQVNLFIRGKKELEPTMEAESLKNHAIKILQEYDRINNLKSYSEYQNRVLTIYSIDGFLQFVSVKFIQDFKESHPDILLNIVENTEKDIIDKLKKRLIYPEAKPNAAHIALAKLEKLGKLKAVLTQNIDGLHQSAKHKSNYATLFSAVVTFISHATGSKTCFWCSVAALQFLLTYL